MSAGCSAAPTPCAWLVETDAVSFPANGPSRPAGLSAHFTEQEARAAAASACEFDVRVFPVFEGVPAAPAATVAAALFPPYMGELIDRAAELLRVHFPAAGPVRFTWWADGKETAYLARLDWPIDGTAHGPRVLVLDSCTGMVVCASKPGRPFDIDPALVNVDTMGNDEIERTVWEARRRGR